MVSRRRRRPGAGFTLLELIVVVTIIGILSTIALPALKNMPRRAAESVLKTDLRAMRDVIDQYYADRGNYPPSLQALVDEGYLRAIPVDPMTGEDEWGLRSFQDEPDSTSWGGEDVYDVYSLSEGVGLNGVPYSEW